MVNLRESEHAIRRSNNFPVIVECIRLFGELRTTTVLKKLPKAEISLTCAWLERLLLATTLELNVRKLKTKLLFLSKL